MKIEIDETELDTSIKNAGKKPKEVKADLQALINNKILRKESVDHLDVCEISGLPPKKAAALYQMILDQIELGSEIKNNTKLSSIKLDQLGVGEEEAKKIFQGHRLILDPSYRFRFIQVSDTHIGSKHDNIEGLEKMFDHAVEIGAKFVTHSGDLVDGAFRHNDMYLFLREDCQGFDGQYDRVVEKWPSRPEMMTYFIAGNHDHFFQDRGGIDICRHIDLARDDMVYLKSATIEEALKKNIDPELMKKIVESKRLGSGRIGALRIGPPSIPADRRNTIWMMMHPGNGSAKALSYKSQEIARTLNFLLNSFENMENPQGKRIKPHGIQIGHYHKVDVNVIRNVYIFQAGTMKLSDEFHETKNLDNTMGYWVTELTTKRNGDIERVTPHFYPPFVEKTRYTRTVVQMKE